MVENVGEVPLVTTASDVAAEAIEDRSVIDAGVGCQRP